MSEALDARLAAIGATPTARGEMLSIEDVERSQHTDCAHRPVCLDAAAVRGWPGWSCSGCVAFVLAPREPLAVRRSGALAMATVSTDNATYGPDHRTREFRRLR